MSFAQKPEQHASKWCHDIGSEDDSFPGMEGSVTKVHFLGAESDNLIASCRS